MFWQTGNLSKVKNECIWYEKNNLRCGQSDASLIWFLPEHLLVLLTMRKGFRCENVRRTFQVLNFMLYEHFSLLDAQFPIMLLSSHDHCIWLYYSLITILENRQIH
jgi:hypothetical protein